MGADGATKDPATAAIGGLEEQVRLLEAGTHACLLYESQEEQLQAITPFLEGGLERGERCVYIADEGMAREALAALAEDGLDVDAQIERGAFVLLSKRDAYLRSGRFEPDAMLELLRQSLERALQEGFCGLRVTGEMTWALGPEPGNDRLLHYECLLNRFFPGTRCSALCQYDATRFPADVLRDVLRAHPTAIIGTEVYDNLFYEPPEMLLGTESAEQRLRWMRSALARVRATERHLAELAERHREAEERFRLLVEGVREYAIFMLDPSGRVATWNQGAERLKGYAASEIIGQHFSVFYPEEERRRRWPDTELDRARAEGKHEEEGWRVRKDGTRFWAHVLITAMRDETGVLRGFSKVTRDLTERKRADDEQRFLSQASLLLAESLELEPTLDRIAHLAVPAVADFCQVKLLDDRRAGRRVGLAHRDPALEQRLREALESHTGGGELPFGSARVMAEGRPNLVAQVTEQMRRAIAVAYPAVADLVRELRPVSLVSVPLRGPQERLIGAISLVTTAESGRQYGERDLALAEELGRRCALAVDNARLFEEATDAVLARDEFLSIASHELKTPLATLQLQMGMFGWLQQDAAFQRSHPWVTKALPIIDRQIRRLDRLVTELLDISRIMGGRLQLELEEVDLAEVVRSVARDLEELSELARSGCELRLELEEGPIGRWDRLRLEQVVTNLLSNAFKYGAGKPVTVTVRAEELGAVLSVRDEGVGIPREDQKRIFGRFERAVSARHYGGLGVGLFVVRQLLEAMGGSIEVRSEPGRGATFVVSLPLDPSAHDR